jgi:HSP20 family protein
MIGAPKKSCREYPTKEEGCRMTLVKWEPFRDLMTLQDKMGRLFSDVFTEPGLLEAESGIVRDWIPAVDIFENTDNIVIKAELPGMEMKDIDVKVEDHTLSIKGERKLEHEEKRENYHRVERVYGAFHRTFALPSSVDAEKIRAGYDKGVLTVTLPKKEETRPRKINIEVK